MINSKEDIPLCESMRAARYDSVDAHSGYAEPDDEIHDKKISCNDVEDNIEVQ